MIFKFQVILAFLTQNYFFSLSQKFLTKKVIFAIFSKNKKQNKKQNKKKQNIFCKIRYQKWILRLISILYTFISITVIV